MEGEARISKTFSALRKFKSSAFNWMKGENISTLQLQGLLLTSTDIHPKKILASIKVQRANFSNESFPPPVTRDFFDKESENTFLCLCAEGYSRPFSQDNLKPSVVTWETVKYMSKIRHTWYPKRRLEQSKSHKPIELSTGAVKYLQQISTKLSACDQNHLKDEIEVYVLDFFREFGSHVSLGPFDIGGRSIERVSCSDFADIAKAELWRYIETQFNDMNPFKVDICSFGGDGLLVHMGGEENIVEFIREVNVFGGNEKAPDFAKWKEGLSDSTLIISGAVSKENVYAVWDIVSNHIETFGESHGALSLLLKETWTKEYGNISFDFDHFKDLDDSQRADVTVGKSGVEMIESASIDSSHTLQFREKREAKVPEILEKLQLSRKIYGLSEATALRKEALCDTDNNEDVIWKFLRLIRSLDYRGRKCFTTQFEQITTGVTNVESSKSSIFDEVDKQETGRGTQNSIISAMDVTFAILHCCDLFLKQELLWKMVECRLAVPILLSSLEDRKRLIFQLWGLRKIYKTWKSKFQNETSLERCVVLQPLPIVSFLRFSDITFSKSKLLNKIMGKLQGNNDHPFFVDMEEERPCATYSKGTIEVAWFLPEGVTGEQDQNALLDAVTFLNLRGHAMDYPIQTEFACRASDIVVALVKKSKYTECKGQIQEISEQMAKHLVVVITSSDKERVGVTRRQGNVTMMRASHHFVTDIGAYICQEMNSILWSPQQCSNSRFKNIDSLTNLCEKLGVEIDAQQGKCQQGKCLAEKLATSISRSEEKYKEMHFPLQGELWKKWASFDKRWCKEYLNERFDSMEHYHDYLKQEMLSIREKQRALPPSNDVITFINALKELPETRQYFIAWLNFFLNDLSHRKLGPLRKELRDAQNKSRDINAEKGKIKTKPVMSKDDEERCARLRDEYSALSEKATRITADLDSASLGMEHYIRELGQRFEAHEELRGEKERVEDHRIDPATLPCIAANLLIDGNPLEILDGDVGRVPIKWVQAVFNSLKQKLGENTMVYAISILGIQSSGKSTLLNSMFGVQFAVSAGRCTRGVFIQLIKVDEDLFKETGCNYVIVIDTEGLKAPERVFHDEFRHDNELATFALCLADLTLINIAGQTVGKDMTDVLQIAAHAFIRMKEVHIKSSCYIIQQFVADLAAVDKNEASTLAILTSLDEAIAAASKDEGYGSMYTQFSDVFHLKRDEDVQYIPSLWQGSMAPPNHRYSEKVLQLKKVVIDEMKHSSRKLEQFAERTFNVWNAVNEENFIFSFQNCVIALRYKNFQHAYGKWIGELREKVMEWESNANQLLKNASKNERQQTKDNLSKNVEEMVKRECEQIEQQVLEYLQENVKDDDYQLHKFQDEFLQDLELSQHSFVQDAKAALRRTTDSLAQLNHMDYILPQCKNQLRQKARSEAAELRGKHSKAANIEKVISKQEVRAKFEELWDNWMTEICNMYPPKKVTMEDVEKEFNSYLVRQGEKKDLSRGLKKKLGIRRKRLKKAPHFESQKEVINMIIENSIGALQVDLGNDLAFDPVIIQKLIDSTIDVLNNDFEGKTLTQEDKTNAIIMVCEKATPIIYYGRLAYNSKYSLREFLKKEKEALAKDFQAIWSNTLQDQRASESLAALLREKVTEIVLNYLGPTIYKQVRVSCPFFRSKFTMIGHILEEMARREDFQLYYEFLFDFDQLLETFCLEITAEVCTRGKLFGKSFVETMVHEKASDILNQVNNSVTSTFDFSKGHEKCSNNYVKLLTWIEQFRDELHKNTPTLRLSEDDKENLLLFDVEDIDKFENQVKTYVEQQLMVDIMNDLNLPSKGNIKKAMELLQRLPTKPHEEIKQHISGCTEQCPICHAPCDNITKRHQIHRAELHYPEGLIGCAKAEDDRLVCSICTSSVTTNETYWDGTTHRKYSDYQKDFPNWVIQSAQNASPLKYWQWVMKRFNQDFARLYKREKAKLPVGWLLITKDQAIRDLRQAYATKKDEERS